MTDQMPQTPTPGVPSTAEAATPGMIQTPMTIAPTTAKPPSPKMGTCEETYAGSGSYYYVFGGEPNRYWTKIKNPDKRILTDHCFRPLDPVSGQKSSRYRTKGLTKKFGTKQSLTEFQQTVWEHLLKFGLDTITYLPDPKSSTLMLSVVTSHAQFTGDIEQAMGQSKSLYKLYDVWDKKHDNEAKSFVIDSLSEELKRDFKPFYDSTTDTFTTTWLKLVHYLVTSNSKNFDNLKEIIRNLKPQQYAGQNIEKMAGDYIIKSQELINGGYFDYSLILNMVDGFLCASPDSKGTFHHTLNTIRVEVESLQQRTVFMDRSRQESEYATKRLTTKDICYKAVKAYKDLCDNNLWEPKKLPKDRHTPASTNVNIVTLAKAMNLVANGQSSKSKPNTSNKSYNKKDLTCFNCGETGHIVPECPHPENKTLQAKLKSQYQTGKVNWRRTPPKPGESETKTFNGKTSYWCDKCKAWTYSHGTSTHKTNMRRRPNRSNNKSAETNLVISEPSAWLVEATPIVKRPSWCLKDVLQYLYFLLTIPILLGIPVQTFTDFIEAMSVPETYQQLYHLIMSYITHQSHQIVTHLGPFLAPILWISLGLSIVTIKAKLTPQFHPLVDLDHRPRHVKRSKSRTPTPTRKLKSAKDHNLIPKYPLKLRHENIYNTRSTTPTIFQREHQEFFNEMIQQGHAQRSHRPSHSRSRSRSSSAYKRKGGLTHATHAFKGGTSTHASKGGARHQSDIKSFCKPKKSRSNGLHYKPVGIANSKSRPNMNLTNSQRKQVQQAATNIFLTGINISNKLKSFAKEISLLSPSSFTSAINSSSKDNQFEVIWDSGASVCVTPHQGDFTTYDKNVDIQSVKGVNGTKSQIHGQGEISWSIIDVHGSLRTFKLKAYHIPSSKARLISTSYLMSKFRDESISIDNSGLKLSGSKFDKNCTPIIAYNNPVTHLPTSTAYKTEATDGPSELLCQTVTTVSSGNKNLNESQKELIRWHQRLGHLEFKKIQHLMRTGVLSHTEGTRHLHTSASKLKEIPKCAACLFGKQTVKSSPGTVTRIVKDRAGILRSGNLLPGQEVSVDHFISSVRGRHFKGYNRGIMEDKFVGGCIFVDHASAHIHIEFQSSLSSHETLSAKMSYENLCKDSGVIPQVYMSDNGKAFTSIEFTEHLSSFFQISKLAGVGAHHHNAQAERSIRTIMSIARTMMMHSGIHWPDVADPSLWPMAVKHATFLYNHVPSHVNGLSPNDLFTKTRWPQRKLIDLHVWGCPVYVLEKSIQDGNKIPKWKARSNRCIYVGVSDSHASSVPLVLNISTGAITPQFHVVFDDWFATVTSEGDNIPDFSSNEWKKMFGESRFQYVQDEDLESNDQETNVSDLKATIKSNEQAEKILKQQEAINPSLPLNTEEPVSNSVNNKPDDFVKVNQDHVEEASQVEFKQESDNEIIEPEPTLSQDENESPKSPKKRAKKLTGIDQAPRRSRRLRHVQAPERFTYSGKTGSYTGNINAYYLTKDHPDDNLVHVQSLLPDHYVLISKKEADPDLFSYDQAMNSEHKFEWIKAAEKEISTLEKYDCWEEIPVKEATTKILPGTWVFKVKRAPDGSFKKFKARYCVRGDLQEGDFETYAPVVQFSSVRLFLAWSLLLNWYTCSVDFSNAFTQAKLKDATFIHLPRGFNSTKGQDTCLRLNRSLYGLAVAPRLWYEHLWKSLEKQGLMKSKHDMCLLLRNNLIVICYVDDLGIQAPTKKIADEFIEALRKDGLELTVEGTFTEYLGIKYDKIDTDTIKMSQEGLIQKIIDATRMKGCNPHPVPTTVEALGTNEGGNYMSDDWNYRSIIGMMLYLSSNTRPDIAYAVSQVARFSHSPKQSHAEAVKTIIRYLSGTKTEGIIFKRPEKLNIECYVDADFAGLYNREDPSNPVSVKSRTGYIISVGGCYILCKSQLQSVIALSTSEAEYGALSHAMRAVIPLRATLLEMINKVDMIDSRSRNPFGQRSSVLKFDTTVYEDNSSALSLALNQKVTSRTKHWSVKFHFFWSYINEDSNHTKCEKVSTDKQKADYLTKGLSKTTFKNCRQLNQGW